MCGTDSYNNDFKAKKYKIEKHSISKVKSNEREPTRREKYYSFV